MTADPLFGDTTYDARAATGIHRARCGYVNNRLPRIRLKPLQKQTLIADPLLFLTPAGLRS
jgi:hypothetical protein